MTLKTFLKRPLNLIGLDLVHYHPRHSMGEYAYVTTMNIKTVIDIGAHSGEFARMIKSMLPEASIISFEPLKDEFEHLQRNMQGTGGFKAFNCAIGDRNDTLTIHHSSYSQSSSLLTMAPLHKQAFPESANQSDEKVEVKRLDDALASMELKPEITLKIDVQGFEDRVIAGGENTIAKSKAVIVEVSFRELYEGQVLFDGIYRAFHDRGFKYMGNLYQLLNPLDGAPLQADALFVRP